jgi:hypothetical protein
MIIRMKSFPTEFQRALYTNVFRYSRLICNEVVSSYGILTGRILCPYLTEFLKMLYSHRCTIISRITDIALLLPADNKIRLTSSSVCWPNNIVF